MAEDRGKVTLKEIARRTGVSVGTVHRVVYGKEGVGDETRARILEEVKRSNYQIDEAASVMKRGIKNVLVVLPKAQNDDRFYFRAIWKGIRKAAEGMEQYKLHYRFVESEYSLNQIEYELKDVYDRYLDRMDGLITVADSEEANRWVGRFAKRGISVILLSTNYYREEQESPSGRIESIRVDHLRSGRLAGEFMKYSLYGKKGRVLIVDQAGDQFGVRLHGQGLMEELQGSCPEIEVTAVASLSQKEAADFFTEEIEKPEVLGVFCCNARNTYRACCILERSGRKQEILTVGSDVFEELIPYYEDGTLNATVCQYHWEQGERAVQKMYEHLSRGIQTTEDVMLPSILVMQNNFRCFV